MIKHPIVRPGLGHFSPAFAKMRPYVGRRPVLVVREGGNDQRHLARLRRDHPVVAHIDQLLAGILRRVGALVDGELDPVLGQLDGPGGGDGRLQMEVGHVAAALARGGLDGPGYLAVSGGTCHVIGSLLPFDLAPLVMPGHRSVLRLTVTMSVIVENGQTKDTNAVWPS